MEDSKFSLAQIVSYAKTYKPLYSPRVKEVVLVVDHLKMKTISRSVNKAWKGRAGRDAT